MKEDIKVVLLNPEEAKKLFRNWGQTSSVCYAADPVKAINQDDQSLERIGRGCMSSGHFSGSRGDFIKFLVYGSSRALIDQLVRHEVGVFKNVQSFRYVGKESFAYDVPDEILDDKMLLKRYDKFMTEAITLYNDIADHVESKGKSQERAHEQARYVLPMSTHSATCIGFTIEGLIHLMNERLCVRAEDRIRYMAGLMRDEVLKVLPELKSRLVPKCEYFLYCTEGKKGCGRYPTKQETAKILNSFWNRSSDFKEAFDNFLKNWDHEQVLNSGLEEESFSKSLIGSYGGDLKNV